MPIVEHREPPNVDASLGEWDAARLVVEIEGIVDRPAYSVAEGYPTLLKLFNEGVKVGLFPTRPDTEFGGLLARAVAKAYSHGLYREAQFLIDAGANTATLLCEVIGGKSADRLDRLLVHLHIPRHSTIPTMYSASRHNSLMAHLLPLQVAYSKSHTPSVNLLMELGHDPAAFDCLAFVGLGRYYPNKLTRPQEAIRIQAIETLGERVRSSAVLNTFVGSGDTYMVERLMAAGAPIDGRRTLADDVVIADVPRKEWPPLVAAANARLPQMVSLLLRHGARVDIANNAPIRAAVRALMDASGDGAVAQGIETYKALIAAGADPLAVEMRAGTDGGEEPVGLQERRQKVIQNGNTLIPEALALIESSRQLARLKRQAVDPSALVAPEAAVATETLGNASKSVSAPSPMRARL